MLSSINMAKETRFVLFLGLMIILVSKATPVVSYAISGRLQPVTSIIGSDDDETHDLPAVITSSQLSRVYVAETSPKDKTEQEKDLTTTAAGNETKSTTTTDGEQTKSEVGSNPTAEKADDLQPVMETNDQSEGQVYPRSATV